MEKRINNQPQQPLCCENANDPLKSVGQETIVEVKRSFGKAPLKALIEKAIIRQLSINDEIAT